MLQAFSGHFVEVEHLGELALFCFGVYCRWELIGVELRQDDVDLDLAVPNRGAARGPLLLRDGLCFNNDGRGLPLVLGEARLELLDLLAEARELVAVGGLAPRLDAAAAARAWNARVSATSASVRRIILCGAGRRIACPESCALSAAAARARASDMALLSPHAVGWLLRAVACWYSARIGLKLRRVNPAG